MTKNKDNEDEQLKTEAEYSAQTIKLLFAIVRWLVITIFFMIVIFLVTIIYILATSNIDIKIDSTERPDNKSTISLYSDKNQTISNLDFSDK